jgi:hypothetical protein
MEKFMGSAASVSELPTARHGVVILIDPPSPHYYENLFFDLNTCLNRDNTLRANHDLKVSLEGAGYPVFTADLYPKIVSHYFGCKFHYWSFGAPATRALTFSGKGVKKLGVILFEPPLVKPEDYKKIDLLVTKFDHVFLHNVIGDGYQLPPTQFMGQLDKFYWTNKNFDGYEWQNGSEDRSSKIALIAGAHFAKAQPNNGYGKRLDAIRYFGFYGDLELFGFGWGKLQLRSPFSSLSWSLKLWMAGKKIPAPTKKSSIYQKYDFAICFENMAMAGYVTEKIFDAFFARSIPIYWGAPDIATLIPSNCFIALDDFKDMEACFEYCLNLTGSEKAVYREAIDNFLNSDEFIKFHYGIHGRLLDMYC